MPFLKKVGSSFRNLRDRIRVSITVTKSNILFFLGVFLVVVLAILIRLSSILRGSLMIKAFDPWIQYYTARYISEHSFYEFFTWHDYKSWFPDGIERFSLRPGLPFTAAAIWALLNFIGIPISIYDVCYFFPAFILDTKN